MTFAGSAPGSALVPVALLRDRLHVVLRAYSDLFEFDIERIDQRLSLSK